MNEYFAQTLAQVLEETSTNMGNAMVLNHLSKKGSVTFEEAEFFHNLCTDVITEAAEDFIPETLEVPEAPEAMAPIELFDAVGNKYYFQDGQLIPAGEEEVAAEEMAPEVQPEMAPEDQYQEGEVAEEGTPVLEEGEVADEAPEATIEEGEVADEAPEAAPVLEEGEVADEAPEAPIEEGTVVVEDEAVEVLEESNTVVARILANMRNA